MVRQPEDRDASRRRVRADPLEYPRAVVKSVAEYVDLGLVPRDQLTVHPDALARGNGHGYTLSAMASPTTPVDGNGEPRSCSARYAETALSIRSRCGLSPRCSSIIDADRIAASGFALPVPAMSCAAPCTGSNSEGPVRAGLRFADAANPMPPATHQRGQ